MADLVWLHEGALRLTHPVFAAGGLHAATIFIWDRDRLAASHVGIKRQLFIYEPLVEMSESCSLDIHEGRAEEVLLRLAAQAGAGRVLVPSSSDTALRAEIGAIRRAAPDLEIVEIEETPFVTLANTPDLGRFFRYWNKARKSALRRQGI